MVKLNFQKQPRGVFCKKEVLRNFAKFAGKHLCQSLFFNKVATLLKKRLWHKCFPANFAKFLRTSFLQNTPRGCFWKLSLTKILLVISKNLKVKTVYNILHNIFGRHTICRSFSLITVSFTKVLFNAYCHAPFSSWTSIF